MSEAGMRGLMMTIAAGFMLVAGATWLTSEDVKYGVGTWDSESGVGNHRAVVRVEAPAKNPIAVRVCIPWRRRDLDPEKKGLVLIDAATGARIKNVCALSVNRESGDIIFEPQTVPGDYYVYYLPYKSEGRKNYPNVKYDPPVETADPQWLASIEAGPAGMPAAKADSLARARLIEIQSVDEFSSFYPMEVIATAEETRALLSAHPDSAYLLFPEDRKFSIRMTADLPERWVAAGPGREFTGEAAPGEYFTFQFGLWAARQAVHDVRVRFTDFTRETSSGQAVGGIIPASAAVCFNTGGSNWDGASFTKVVDVEQGKVQAFWCGVQVPKDAAAGDYSGTATVAPRGLPETAVRLVLRVAGPVLADAGDSNPFRMTRLRWLDSRLAFDDGIVPPYTPLAIDGLTVSCLGRSVELGKDGLPSRIRSSFAPEMTRFEKAAHPVTSAPFRLRVTDANHREASWSQPSRSIRFTKQTAGSVAWEAESRAGDLTMTVSAVMEFEGYIGYKVALTAARDTAVSDIRLEIPFAPESARFMMGLGFKGGERPETFDWTWDRKKNQDALWVGGVNGGIQVSLRAENYSRPLNTNFYLSKPLNMPPSWWNDGQGGVSVRRGPSAVMVAAFSGPRTIKAGEVLHFDFTLLLTPFKLITPEGHFSERYYHAYRPLVEVAAAGANVVNIHHATDINPFINYPFLRPEAMKAYIDDAHRRGFKVKIYDTIRELSNRAAELFMMRSLGHEVFSAGPGGGFSWLQEHVGGDYIAAWFVPELKDAAIINSGMSRWHNYYIEGLDWLARNVGIDGLYLDDVAFDRTTMKRARKVLDRNRPGTLIDLHSANQYNPRDGFASSANLYLEHFPFLDRLWFGEYFDYNSSGPDYWLVEMSGIPFGLMGEMLQDGGNPWRGMVFGMTSRLPWAGDPRPLWKAWDEFGIVGSEMIGWWAPANPVRTGRGDVLATVYIRRPDSGTVRGDVLATVYVRRSSNGPGRGAEDSGRMAGKPHVSDERHAESKGPAQSRDRPSILIALASWAKEPVDIRLSIDWKALGLSAQAAALRAPEIEKFQPAADFKPSDPIRIEPGKGRLLLLK